jgi:hypothetical protein
LVIAEDITLFVQYTYEVSIPLPSFFDEMEAAFRRAVSPQKHEGGIESVKRKQLPLQPNLPLVVASSQQQPSKKTFEIISYTIIYIYIHYAPN